jgi:hypothetical protein
VISGFHVLNGMLQHGVYQMPTSAMPEDGRSRGSERNIDKPALSILGFVLGLIALLSLIIVALPKIARGWAVSQLTSVLIHKVEIDNLEMNIITGHIHVGGLRIRSIEDNSELAAIRQINADVEVLPLFKREVSLSRLNLVSPIVHLLRTEDSGWNIPALDARDSSSDSKAGISINVQNAVLRDGSLIIEDRSVSPARTEHMDDIQLTLMNISTASSDPAEIHGSARVSDSGTIMIEGAVLSDLRSGNMKVDLTDVSLAPLQEYFSGHMRVKGRVNAHLSVTWPSKGESPVVVSGALEGHDLTLSSFGRPMGHVAMVSVSQGEVMWPDMVAMDRFVVNKPEIWVHRNESGRFVGLGAGKGDSPNPTPTSRSKKINSGAATTPTQWRIGKIVVRGGTVHLEDRSVTPVYSDVLENFEMTLDDFMSTPDHPVMIAARADIASGGALALQGRAALLGPTPSLSLKASIHRMVVPSTNPYLERTVSHYTTDGTLTTAMDIRLSDDRLEVTSDVTLSNLQVEPIQNSTHRTVQERIGLPLGLLITLLKDDAGHIVITFPVSGPLSNPTFDWTNAIWATIRNAVIKLITLPIHSIGRFVMGGHQLDELALDPISFDPGSSAIRPDMERKLQDLAKLLHSANRTVLHITPVLSPADLEAFRRLPPASWPVPDLDTPETAGHVLAVRRAYMVAARLAGLKKLSSARLPVDPPRQDTSDQGMPRVELQLEKADGANVIGRTLSRNQG